jgi:hypothetical protein
MEGNSDSVDNCWPEIPPPIIDTGLVYLVQYLHRWLNGVTEAMISNKNTSLKETGQAMYV